MSPLRSFSQMRRYCLGPYCCRLIVASLRRVAARCRFDDDRADHVGVWITEVLISPRRGEGERIVFVSVERPRFLKGVIRRGVSLSASCPVHEAYSMRVWRYNRC